MSFLQRIQISKKNFFFLFLFFFCGGGGEGEVAGKVGLA